MDAKTETEVEATEEYLKFLLAFRALPEAKRNRTFMEVSGYPHYENVCTNILRFYLDPGAEHGLGNLLISAFLRMAGVEETPELNNVSVRTRLSTNGGNSIDLVIDGEALTIGIENKIFHWLANDLVDYGKFIDELGKKKRVIIKAVLGLHLIQDQETLTGRFVSYTYSQLWQQVRGMLGHYIRNADPKWLSYLVDLMETTANLAGENMQLKKTDRFFVDNHELIEKMLVERDDFLERLNQKVGTLATMMSEVTEAKALIKTPWVYASSCVVLDYVLEKTYSVSFDLYLRPTGWELQLFGRTKKSQVYLAELMKQPALRSQSAGAVTVNSRHIVQRWGIEADLGEIRDTLTSWMRSVVISATGKRK